MFTAHLHSNNNTMGHRKPRGAREERAVPLHGGLPEAGAVGLLLKAQRLRKHLTSGRRACPRRG